MPRTRLAAWVPPALTFLLGLWGLTRENSMWRDEAATWQAAHRSIPEIWHLLGRADVVHGLYYLFMHGVFTVFGDSLLTLRLPSVLAMTGAAALITRLGCRMAGRCAGVAAGLAFALLPAIQQYAQEGRAYALVTACAALACRLLVAAVAGQDRGPGPWAAYAAVVLLAALLNWFSLLLLFAHAVTLALVRPPRATVLRGAVAAGAAVLGALPLIAASGAQSGQVAWIPPAGPSTLLGLLVTLLAGVLCAWLIRSVPVAARAHGDTRISLTALALPLLAVPPLLLLTVSLSRPVYLTRYVLFSHLGLALLIGGACHALAIRLRTSPRQTIVTVTALAFLALLPVQLTLRSASGRIDDVLATADDVAAVREQGDAVLYIPEARRDTALVSPADFAGLNDVALVRDPSASGTLSGREGTPRQIAKAMLTARRIVVVTDASESSAATARDRTKQHILKAYFARCSETSDRGRKVVVYRRRLR